MRALLKSLRGKRGVILACAAGILYWGCKASSGGQNALKEAIVDGPQFAKVTLAMSADSLSGTVYASFDPAGAINPGDTVELVWDVLQTSGDINCSALRNKETITIPAGGARVELKFQVDPKRLNDKIEPMSKMVPRLNTKYGHLKMGEHFKGNTVIEGCLAIRGKGVLARGRNQPEPGAGTSALALLGNEADLPVHIRYAERCAEAIGYVAPIDCVALGQTVPITSNGVVQTSVSQTCDRPVYLEGPNRCGPFTRVGRPKIFKDKAMTQPAENTTGVFFCRHYGDASTVSAPGDATLTREKYPYFADVAIIMQNIDSGKTCFFQALGRDSGETLYGRRVPAPTETDDEWTAAVTPDEKANGAGPASAFWLAPANIAAIHCVSCHDNDPFMHSPWIDQMRVLAGDGQRTAELLVPSVPELNYNIVGAGFGFEDWATAYSFDLPDNKCTTCHRISTMNTCRTWLKDAYPKHADGAAPALEDFYLGATGEGNRLSDTAKKHSFHHWMPPPPDQAARIPLWERKLGTFAASVDQLRDCCSLKMDGATTPILNYGFINNVAPDEKKDLTTEEQEYLRAKGCPVIPHSKVVER